MAQGGAVRVEPVADDGADVLLDIAEALDAHGGKDPEALALEVPEHRAGVLPVVAVGPLPVGVEQDGGGAHQAAHLVEPPLGVCLDGLHGLGAQADVAPGVAAEGPAGALELRDDGLHRLNLPLAVGLLGLGPALGVRLGPVAQDALVAGEAQAPLGAEGGEVRVLLHELVQDGDGVQVPADHLVALGVLAPGGDLAGLADDQLVGKAVLEHIVVVIGVVVGEDQGLFALRQVEGVLHHLGLTVLAGGLAPHIADVHQNIALVIDALEDLVVLVHRHHVVVQAVGLGVPVEGQLRIGDDGMEEQMLHNAVIGHIGHPVPDAALRHHGGIQNVIGLRLRGQDLHGLAAGILRVLLRDGGVLTAAGGQREQRQHSKQQGSETAHNGMFLSVEICRCP